MLNRCIHGYSWDVWSGKSYAKIVSGDFNTPHSIMHLFFSYIYNLRPLNTEHKAIG
jgi:hypothetical protein